MTASASGTRSKRRPLRVMRFVALASLPVPFTLWAVAALYFDVQVPWLRAPLAAAYVVSMAAVWLSVKRRWLALGLSAGGCVLVTAWWLSLKPCNDRDWQPDVAVLAYADIQQNKVTIHNIRNCEYRSETDFDVRHYDKTLDLDQLREADIYMVYWGSPNIAHTMISFGFEGGDHLCFSIETRKFLDQTRFPQWQHGEVHVVSLHRHMTVPLKVEFPARQRREVSAKAVSLMAGCSDDGRIPGYPYPLLEAHRAALISQAVIDQVRQHVLAALSREGISRVTFSEMFSDYHDEFRRY